MTDSEKDRLEQLLTDDDDDVRASDIECNEDKAEVRLCVHTESTERY